MRRSADIVAALDLEPHPEGGFFRETYRARATSRTSRGERALATAVLFLVTAHSPSRLHRLAADELWIHQDGAPLEMGLLSSRWPRGRELLLAGPTRAAAGGPRLPDETAVPQLLVPAGTWQAARIAGDHTDWSLVTCVVTPGFELEDFEIGAADELLRLFPEAGDLVRRHV